jgi:quercetin dioxygenase-like cupin family protein
MEAQGRTPSIVLGPGEGRILEARGSVMAFKAVAATTGGRFSMMDRRLPPGGRMPPPHRHPATVEAFLVLEGSVTFMLDGEPTTAAEGGFVLVGEGVSHTFGNVSAQPARVVIVHAPALDGYFEELAELWSRPEPPAPEVELALMRRHGLEPTGS